jgi:hypothetical protein
VAPVQTFLDLDAAAATCLTTTMTLRRLVVLSAVALAALPPVMTKTVTGHGAIGFSIR